MSKATLKSKTATSAQEGSDLPKLSQPALRALAAAGVKRLDQLTRFSEAEVKEWHGIGPNALTSLRRALNEKDLSFTLNKGKNNTKQGKYNESKR